MPDILARDPDWFDRRPRTSEQRAHEGEGAAPAAAAVPASPSGENGALSFAMVLGIAAQSGTDGK